MNLAGTGFSANQRSRTGLSSLLDVRYTPSITGKGESHVRFSTLGENPLEGHLS